MGTSDAETNQWLRELPKAELHLHLEGTVTPETLVTLSKRHDVVPLTIEEARALYSYKDFLHFLQCFRSVTSRLQTPEDYALIVHEMIRGLAAQGVVHAEVFVAWGGVLRYRTHLEFGTVMAAMEAERLTGEAELGVSLLWIIDATRQFGVEDCGRIFELAAKWRSTYPSIVGVGIGGDEVQGPCILFEEVYARAKAAGLRLTVHAGESTGSIQGPQSIRDALHIGAERIGHGVCAAFDEQLMDLLRDRGTPMEVCVTSNFRTGVCPVPDEHPLKIFMAKGLMVTINSDDPAMFWSNLLEEYIYIQHSLNLSKEQMRTFASNSIHASFLSEERKNQFLSRIDAFEI